MTWGCSFWWISVDFVILELQVEICAAGGGFAASVFCVATLRYVAVYSLCTHPKICPPPRSVEVLCTTPKVPPPPGALHTFASYLLTTLTADKRDITWAPDWGAYEMVLGLVDPGHEEGCLECYARRGQWHIPGFEKQPVRLVQHCRTACKRFLQLFPDRRNIVYDPLHCIALVLTMILLHALDLLFQDKYPNHVEELRRIYRQHIQGGEYRGPAHAGPEYKGWKLSNNQAKALLDTEEFWAALAGLFGRACAHVVDDLVFYVNELRRLADQLLSWNPSRVSTRNADCDRLHALYIQLGLPKERITAQVHDFLCHYQSWLEWHGNLQGLNTEGGEHCHGHDK